MATKFGPGLAKAAKDAIYTVKSWVHWSGVIIGGLSLGVGLLEGYSEDGRLSSVLMILFSCGIGLGNGDKT